MEEIFHQAVVGAVVERDEGLDAGVAQVLKLLIVGAVHIGFHGAETGRAPADLQHVLQFLVTGAEGRLQGERIAGEGAAHVLDGEGIGGGLHLQLHIAVGAPVQRGEGLPLLPVAGEDVFPADEHLPVHFVTVSLTHGAGQARPAGILGDDFSGNIVDINAGGNVRLALVFCGDEERFGIADVQFRILPAMHGHVEVGVGEEALVQQDHGLGVGRNGKRGFSLQEAGGNRNALCLADRSETLRRKLHLGKHGGD